MRVVRRYAIRVAYDGTRFAGSQVQPGVRTVHGELARALAEADPDAPGELRWAGRTDAGVSSRGNVVALASSLAPEPLLAALSFRLEDAWCWAAAPVDDAFEPRRAARRTYRYFLRTGADAKRVETALDPFVGTHDFTAFARIEPHVDPVRTVHAVAARRESPFVVVDIVGASFVWNQVRRMVEAARREAEGDLPPGRIAETLAAARPADLGTAPPEGLLLLDVDYPGLSWTSAPAKVLDRLRRRLEEPERALALGRAMLEGA